MEVDQDGLFTGPRKRTWEGGAPSGGNWSWGEVVSPRGSGSPPGAAPSRTPIVPPLELPNAENHDTAAQQCPAPPGDCTPEQHRDYQNRVKNACNSAKSCTGADSPAALMRKISDHSRCIDARKRINTICFRGGDFTHNEEIRNRITAIDQCKRFLGQ